MRRLVTAGTSLAIAVSSFGVGVATRPAAAATRSGCPAPESLVPNATWHHHTLAKGVTLAEGQARDSRGLVDMHVLRVNLTGKHVHVGPLAHSLASRSSLSELASGHRHLVAATNTGYFDFIRGTPTGPFVSGGVPLVLSTRHQKVAGIGTTGLAQGGRIWLTGKISVGGSKHRLGSINELRPARGLSLYTGAWGSRSVYIHGSYVARRISSRRISATSHSSTVGSGALLIARSAAARSWLSGLSSGSKVSYSGLHIGRTTHRAFKQAYGVGTQTVKRAGHPLTGFNCHSGRTKQPARTMIGFAKGGKQLILVAVADHPHTSMHGLDEDQMSKLMVQLHASRAYAFDGSGSTEMLAKLPGQGLSIRNYCADGAERPMPLGLGIYRS